MPDSQVYCFLQSLDDANSQVRLFLQLLDEFLSQCRISFWVQGLAPHHDDVEIFVCQTEGSKRWRLYKPHKGFPLPNQPSGDLREEELSELVMDVTLKVLTVLW